MPRRLKSRKNHSMKKQRVGRKFSNRFKRRFGSKHYQIKFNGPTQYQEQVNSLTGAMGPTNSAFWKNTMTTTGYPWDLGAQPLFYSPALGRYVTSFEQNVAPMSVAFQQMPNATAEIGTVNFSSGFGRRKSRKSRKLRRMGSKIKKMESRKLKRRSMGKKKVQTKN